MKQIKLAKYLLLFVPVFFICWLPIIRTLKHTKLTFPVVLRLCEALCHIKGNTWLGVFGNSFFRGICGPKGEEVTEEWSAVFSSPNIVRERIG
jgi:hypothetical protein